MNNQCNLKALIRNRQAFKELALSAISELDKVPCDEKSLREALRYVYFSMGSSMVPASASPMFEDKDGGNSCPPPSAN